MEERLTEALYLEMSEASPAAYAEKRVQEVLALPGVARSTWWDNERPGRDEFPRTLEEFRTLGVYEVSDAFLPPTPSPPLRGLYFRRTERPPQGNLSDKPTTGLLLVLVTPTTPADARAFRDWADFVHIRHIAAAGVDGFTMITPYESVDGGSPRYLHFYEMDAAEPEAAFSQMARQTAKRRLGGFETAAYEAWATHDALAIDYVNTFRRVGCAGG